MFEKVISGGQTGADQAGLAAARACGLSTGGWLPYKCVTTDGESPHLLYLYGMQEHTGGYKPRTWANVEDSDGTIRIFRKEDSPGERCTLNGIRHHGKPHFDVDLSRTPLVNPVLVREWIAIKNIRTLNVAGNAERTAPGIFHEAFIYLLKVFEYLEHTCQEKS